MKNTRKKFATDKLVLSGMMTALVVVFQLLATYTTFFGPFSTAIALIPIAIGAALCGPLVGAWLGLVFAVVVLASGGAALFFAFSIVGTVVTVVAKGSACGFVSGIVYRVLEKFNKTVAAIASAIVCPIVNTGVFLLGCLTFFMPYADRIAETVGIKDAGFAVFLALAFGNFIFELLMSAVLAPVVVRVIDMKKK